MDRVIGPGFAWGSVGEGSPSEGSFMLCSRRVAVVCGGLLFSVLGAAPLPAAAGARHGRTDCDPTPLKESAPVCLAIRTFVATHAKEATEKQAGTYGLFL